MDRDVVVVTGFQKVAMGQNESGVTEIWSGRQDLNLRPQRPERCALHHTELLPVALILPEDGQKCHSFLAAGRKKIRPQGPEPLLFPQKSLPLTREALFFPSEWALPESPGSLLNPFYTPLDILHRRRKGESEVALFPKFGTRYNGNKKMVEKNLGEVADPVDLFSFIGFSNNRSEIREDVKSAFRIIAGYSVDLSKSLEEECSPFVELCHHGRDEVLGTAEGGDGRLL